MTRASTQDYCQQLSRKPLHSHTHQYRGYFHVLCRHALLGGSAFFQGATLGPLISLGLATHPGLLAVAFLGSSAVFACFSLAALLSQRRRSDPATTCHLTLHK